VSLRHAKKERQVKRTAPASSWSPHTGLIAISYRPSMAEDDQSIQPPVEAIEPTKPEPHHMPAGPQQHAAPAEAVERTKREPAEVASDPARDVVTALAKAEKDPQLGFVALKWFRDTYLPQQGYPWAAIPDDRQRVLANAIDRNWILTSKVANPKNPQFPVTSIKVNRPLADVRDILDREPGYRSGFNPVAMRGEPLSQTILRERR